MSESIVDEVSEAPSKSYACLSLPMKSLYDILKGLKRILPSRKSDMPVDSEDCVQFQVTEQQKALIWGRKKSRQLVFELNQDDENVSLITSGTFSIPVRSLYKPIQKLKKQGGRVMLTAEADELEVDAGKARFTKDLMFHSDIDTLPGGLNRINPPSDYTHTMNMGDFRSLFERVGLAADLDAERREYLRYILLREGEEHTLAMASDGCIVSKAVLDMPIHEDILVHPDDLDPVYKTFSKSGDVHLAISSDSLHCHQGSALFSIATEPGVDFPPLEQKLPDWGDNDFSVRVGKSELKAGVDFLDALGKGDNIRLLANGCPLRLQNGKFSETPEDSYQLNTGDGTFPSSEIQRDYVKDIMKNAEGKMLIATKDDGDQPVHFHDGEASWFVMKIADGSP